MTTIPAPNACRHCPLEQREHGRQWTAEVGWHAWEPPTQAQIKARIQARRQAAP